MSTESADVIVIGGGILGAATALHLIEAGAGRVLLLERDEVAGATSNAGAGFVAAWAAGYAPAWDEVELEMELYGLQRYLALAGAGRELGLSANGNLWAATTDAAWERHVRPLIEHPAPVERRALDPGQVQEHCPIIRADSVVGGVLHPGGVQVSAAAVTRVVARRFCELGGRVATRRPVTGLASSGGRVIGVRTDAGTIGCDRVVIAAGAWSNELLAEQGWWAPMAPLIASRIITEPIGIERSMPTVMLPEFGLIWLRGYEGRLLWGAPYDCAPRHVLIDAPKPGRLDQVALDGVLANQRIASAASAAIPILARYASLTVAHGAPTYTADTRSLIGAVPGVEGAVLVGGCNETGITHAMGFGRLAAQLTLGGDADPHARRALDPTRFDGSALRTERDVVEAMRAVEGSLWVAT